MKKKIAVISAFIIGMGCCSSEMVVMAAQKSVYSPSKIDWESVSNLWETYQIEEIQEQNNLFNISGSKEDTKDSESSSDSEDIPGNEEESLDDPQKSPETQEKTSDETEHKEGSPISQEMNSLQMPQKLEVIIDPWNIEGKGQIYSEQYVIRNMGEKAGVLTLSNLICKPREEGSVILRTEKAGMHGDGEKSVYIEMLFGNGERIVLSEDGTEYQAELQPGEELSVCFAGEVNESASEEWKNGDISVGAIYDWNTLPIEENGEQQDQLSPDESGEKSENEGELQEEEPDTENHPDEEKQVVELQTAQNLEFTVDTWRTDVNGAELSKQYVFRNIGEIKGVLELTDFVCKSKEQSKMNLVSTPEELYESIEPCFYMEMIYGDGEEERINLSGESVEYQYELEPGEEAVIWFTGRTNHNAAPNFTENAVTVTAACFWNVNGLVE